MKVSTSTFWIFLLPQAFASRLSCADCEIAMGALLSKWSSPAEIQQQTYILLASDACKNVAQAAANAEIDFTLSDCIAGLPDYWNSTAPVRWSGFLSSKYWCHDFCSEEVRYERPDARFN